MEDERIKLLYIELPNLVHRILKMSLLPLPKRKKRTEITIEEVKKVINAECESALIGFKH